MPVWRLYILCLSPNMIDWQPPSVFLTVNLLLNWKFPPPWTENTLPFILKTPFDSRMYCYCSKFVKIWRSIFLCLFSCSLCLSIFSIHLFLEIHLFLFTYLPLNLFLGMHLCLFVCPLLLFGEISTTVSSTFLENELSIYTF